MSSGHSFPRISTAFVIRLDLASASLGEADSVVEATVTVFVVANVIAVSEIKQPCTVTVAPNII
jgi:hypothetical protein